MIQSTNQSTYNYPSPWELTRQIIRCPKCGSATVKPLHTKEGRCCACNFTGNAEKFLTIKLKRRRYNE